MSVCFKYSSWCVSYSLRGFTVLFSWRSLRREILLYGDLTCTKHNAKGPSPLPALLRGREVLVHGVHGLQDAAGDAGELTHLLRLRHARDFDVYRARGHDEERLASCHITVDSREQTLAASHVVGE